MITGQVVPDILKYHSTFNFIMQANKNGCVGQTLCDNNLDHFIYVTHSQPFSDPYTSSIIYFLFSATLFYYIPTVIPDALMNAIRFYKFATLNTPLPQTSAVQVSNSVSVHIPYYPLCYFPNAPASNYNPHGSSPSVVNYYPHHIPIYTLFVPCGSSS